MTSFVLEIIRHSLDSCLGFFETLNDSFFGVGGTLTFVTSVVIVWAVYRLIIQPFVGGSARSDSVKKKKNKKGANE